MPLIVEKSSYLTFSIAHNNINGLLSAVKNSGINMLAYKSKTIDSEFREFTIVTDDTTKLINAAKSSDFAADGPYPAVIIKSNTDEPGELANIYNKLSEVNIHPTEATGIANLADHYGVILYFQGDDCDIALNILKGIS